MLKLLVVALAIVAIVIAARWFRRRGTPKEEEPPLDLTLILREPRVLTEEHLRSAVLRAFGKDLANHGEEATEFVIARGSMGVVQIEGYGFPILSAPEPMVPDPEKAAEEISELRTRVAFAEHQGFIRIGCAMRPPGSTRADAYARMGRLAAELVDETTLIVYSDETRTGNLANEETIAGLRSGDPLATLRTVNFNAIGLVSGEDPRLVAATAEARRRLPEFVAAFDAASDRSAFLVKGPFTDGTHTEFMWVSPKAIEGEAIRGTLANQPFQVRGLREGSEVTVAFGDVSDWVYVGDDGPVGMFTEAIVRGAL